MKYSELELKKMNKMGDLTIEDKIKFNILNFIHTIHLNNQDFIDSSYDKGTSDCVRARGDGSFVLLLFVLSKI